MSFKFLPIVAVWAGILGFNSSVSAQQWTESIPQIIHYSKNDFQADAQFWTMTEDSQGVLYFGNNDGVLVFDGERWQKVSLPNHSSVRSLITADNGLIYTGGYSEIGTIEKDENGTYYYSSLNEALKLDRERSENFWQVHQFKGFIIFRSFNELVVISDKTATHIKSNNRFTRSDVVSGHFYVQDMDHGIYEFDPVQLSLERVVEAAGAKDYIVSMVPGESPKHLLTISKAGVVSKINTYTGQTQVINKIFEENEPNQVISALAHNNEVLLGTLTSGIMVLQKDGQVIKDPRSFSRLHNSAVLSLHPSRDCQNLWVLMNNGLDYVQYDSPVSHLFEGASIYDILIHQDKIYLATNTGVFYSSFDKDQLAEADLDFIEIPELEGQAWSVKEADGVVVVGHDKGLFYLDGQKPFQIGHQNGFWKIIPTGNAASPYIASNYNGLYPLVFENGAWTLREKIRGFEDSGRDIIKGEQENTYWVCHGYKGVFKLKMDENLSRVYALEHYTDKNGLPSPFNVNATLWNEEVVFTTNTGIYSFDPESHDFVPHKELNLVLDTMYNTRKLIQTKNRAWFVQDDEVGFFDLEKKELQKNLFLNLKGNLNRSMESIVPIGNGRVLVGATNGLFMYNIHPDPLRSRPSTRITSVVFNSEQEEYFVVNPKDEVYLPNKKGFLRFEFSSPELSPGSEKQYQYLLEGISSEWSDWSQTSYKEYAHLAPGSYTFRVRSRNFIGQTAQEAAYNFVVPPLWYQTNIAYISYFLIFGGLVYLLLHLVQRKFDKERIRAQIAAEKSEKLLQLEIDQLKLRQDREVIQKHKQELEEDNIRQSKELANYTMLLVKKKEIFTETYSNLKEFRDTLRTQAARQRLQEVLKKLNQHRIGEEYMNIFDVNFEKVHKNFFKRLKELCPGLTKRELRLCAFVKMNLTNKEIAPLLNISVRGVETARYRVRKKLDVQEASFTAFLENLTEPVAA